MSPPSKQDMRDLQIRMSSVADFYRNYIGKDGKINGQKVVAAWSSMCVDLANCKENAERLLWLVHTANEDEIRATLLSRKQPHEIIEGIDIRMEAALSGGGEE